MWLPFLRPEIMSISTALGKPVQLSVVDSFLLRYCISEPIQGIRHSGSAVAIQLQLINNASDNIPVGFSRAKEDIKHRVSARLRDIFRCWALRHDYIRQTIEIALDAARDTDSSEEFASIRQWIITHEFESRYEFADDTIFWNLYEAEYYKILDQSKQPEITRRSKCQ